jgi:phosphatidylserine/phosphatidylglycerophosphate/cardiolipin synthase-like enzyme
MTYGIHPLLIGALKVTAQRVWVKGIVSGAKGEVVSEAVLSELIDEDQDAFRMIVKHYGAESGYQGMPHQKLVVIDGLLAFKGAANLTLAGWRKAAHGRDVVEVVTDVDEVIDLNNRFFSPIWAELEDFGDSIRMNW